MFSHWLKGHIASISVGLFVCLSIYLSICPLPWRWEQQRKRRQVEAGYLLKISYPEYRRLHNGRLFPECSDWQWLCENYKDACEGDAVSKAALEQMTCCTSRDATGLHPGNQLASLAQPSPAQLLTWHHHFLTHGRSTVQLGSTEFNSRSQAATGIL